MKGGQSFRMVLLGCSLVLTVLFAEVRPAAAQAEGASILPPGVDPPVDSRVTAQQVENGSATLKDFALSEISLAEEQLTKESLEDRITWQCQSFPTTFQLSLSAMSGGQKRQT